MRDSGLKKKQSGWIKTASAVAWSFLGIRRKGAFDSDIRTLKPWHVIGVGLIGGFLFVLFLMLIVRWVV